MKISEIWIHFKKKAAGNVASLALSRFLGQILSVLAIPIISRIFDPAAIGEFTAFSTILVFVLSISTFQTENILISATEEEAESLIKIGVILTALFSLFAVLNVGLLHASGYENFGVFGGSVLVLFGLTLWGNSLLKIIRAACVRDVRYHAISKMTLLSNVSSNGLKVILGTTLRPSSLVLIMSDVASVAINVAYMSRFVAWRRVLHRPAHLGLYFKKYRSYITWGQLSTVIDNLGLLLPFQFFLAIFGAHQAGLLALAMKVVSVVNQNLGNAVADVFVGEMAKRLRDKDYDSARRLFYRFLRILVCVAIPSCLILMGIATYVVPVVLGAKWSESGPMVVALAPWYFSALVVSPLSQVLIITHDIRYKLIYDISALLSSITVFGLSRSFQFSTTTFLLAMTSLQTLSYLVFFVVIRWRLLRYQNASSDSRLDP